MKIDIKGSGFGCILSMLAIFAACGYGWVMNIVKIVHVFNDPLTTMTVVRMIGVPVWPIGVALWLIS